MTLERLIDVLWLVKIGHKLGHYQHARALLDEIERA